MNSIYTRIAAVFAVLMLPNLAWAQIVYAPAGAGVSIPTLSASMLVFLAALLMVVTKLVGFKRASGMGKTLGLLAICTVASGAFSVKLISDAYADGGGGGGGTVRGFLSSASGGSVPINEGVLNIFENTSGAAQRIVAVNITTCPNTNSGLIDGAPQCAPNAVVPTDVNGLCYTDCRPH